MGPELLLAAGVSAASGGLSLVQAQQQNKANERAAAVQKEQNRISSEQRKNQLARELQEFQGTLRTTSAARGTAGAASSAAINTSAINTAGVGNYNATLQQLFGNASADSQAAARYNNPFTSLFGGALSGFSTGLSLGGVIYD
jgi:hypothetical protein